VTLGDTEAEGPPGPLGPDGADGPGGPNGIAPGESGPGGDGPGEDDVLGFDETSPAAGNGAETAPDLAEEANDGGGDKALPFTGLRLPAILVIALLALAAGVATRRIASRSGT
jgi:hypothetical protein